MFADNVTKYNPYNKPQSRVLIVTDLNIYKYEPKKYTVRKVGIPLQEVRGISLSPNTDCFAVIHMRPPQRDLLINVEDEKVCEFVTVLYQQTLKIARKDIPIHFGNHITYNNNRDAKNKGVDCDLSFSLNPRPKGNHSIFQKGKGNTATVLYPKPNVSFLNGKYMLQ